MPARAAASAAGAGPTARRSKGILRDFVDCYTAGVAASLACGRAWSIFTKAHKARRRAAQCVLLNGILFLGSMALVDHLVLPMVARLLVNERPGFEKLAHTLNRLLEIMCRVLWLYPVFALSFLISTLWYQDIAEDAYNALRPNPVAFSLSWQQVVWMLASQVFRLLVVLIFLLESTVVYFVPVVGAPLSFALTAWLYSFYAFEYKWAAQRWGVERRLEFFERRWAYFIGFGTACTGATFYASVLVSSGLYATLFPLFIVLALDARPEEAEPPPDSPLPRHLPIFGLSRWLTDFLLRRLPDPAAPARAR
eukprot:tig00001623_g9420.t1